LTLGTVGSITAHRSSVAHQILAGDLFNPQISPLYLVPLSLTNTVLLGATQVSQPNGISFLPAALAGYLNVTDSRPCYNNVYYGSRYSRCFGDATG